MDGPESIALVRPFVKRYKYTFPVLFDTESKVIALYNPRVIMPYTVLIGRDGMIHGVHQGYSLGDEKVIEEEILKLLEPQEQAARGGRAAYGSLGRLRTVCQNKVLTWAPLRSHTS